MTTKSETPRITELHVRMDCNGCENKIRKTLRAIDGVSEVYVDKASHKITVVGMADPGRMVKAIRKAKRVPTIFFSHTDPAAAAEAQPPPSPAEAEGEAQAPPPPADPPAADKAEEAAPAETPAPENKEAKPAETPAAVEATVVVRTVHDHSYGYGGHGHRMYSEANHPIDSYYSHHRPTSPYVAEYGGFTVQEGRYYVPAEYYPGRGKEDDSHITCMFSDENPNACSIA